MDLIQTLIEDYFTKEFMNETREENQELEEIGGEKGIERANE